MAAVPDMSGAAAADPPAPPDHIVSALPSHSKKKKNRFTADADAKKLHVPSVQGTFNIIFKDSYCKIYILSRNRNNCNYTVLHSESWRLLTWMIIAFKQYCTVNPLTWMIMPIPGAASVLMRDIFSSSYRSDT